MKRLLNLLRPKQASVTENEDLRVRLGQSAILAQRATRDSMRHLWDAEVSVFSQWGEDGILDYLCDLMDISKPRVVEFGAGSFNECNSRFLAENRSASVLAVDARSDLKTSVMQRDIRWRTTVIPRVEWITPETAPEAMKFAKDAFGGVDIVSLDIDGNDYWVAESLLLEGVQIIVVEYNPLFGHKMAVSIPRADYFDRTAAHYSWLYYGASIMAFIQLFTRKGFTFAGTNRVGNNAFFIADGCKIPFQTTPPKDLAPYTDWRVREGRDPEGQLTLEVQAESIKRLAHLPLVATDTLAFITVGDAH